jgi:hypothetical protein
VGDDVVEIGTACPEAPARIKGTAKGTRVRVRWPLCEGLTGTVKLRAKTDVACGVLSGKLIAKKSKLRREFTAMRSICGNGVVDTVAGEQCEDAIDCTPPASCSGTCLCDGTTTTTTGGGTTTLTVTTTSLASTSTTASSSTSTSTLPGTLPPDPSTVAPVRTRASLRASPPRAAFW